MSLIIKALQVYVPQPVKKQRLKQLFRLTADAFEVRTPDTSGLSYDQLLRQYALFTKEEAKRPSGEIAACRRSVTACTEMPARWGKN